MTFSNVLKTILHHFSTCRRHECQIPKRWLKESSLFNPVWLHQEPCLLSLPWNGTSKLILTIRNASPTRGRADIIEPIIVPSELLTLHFFTVWWPSRLSNVQPLQEMKVKITLMHTDSYMYTHFGALFKVNISHSEKRKENTYTGHENKPNLPFFPHTKIMLLSPSGQARLRNWTKLVVGTSISPYWVRKIKHKSYFLPLGLVVA